MKSIFLMAMGLTTAAYAQPVITPANLSNYLPTEALTASTVGFDPGTPGANKTWNFSQLAFTPSGTNDVMLPKDIASKNPFPAATLCLSYTGKVGEGFLFFKHDANKLEWIGQSFDGVGTVACTANPKTVLTFPYAYQTQITDDFQIDGTQQATNFSSVYDAYGTLIMPYGTHRNVIRQRIVVDGQADYIWFNAHPFYPILQTDMSRGTLGVMMLAEASAGFEPNRSFQVTEQACLGRYDIVTGHAMADIKVYDLDGKTVAATQANNGVATIDLQHGPCGIYIATIKTADGYAMQKLIKTSAEKRRSTPSAPCDDTALLNR
ncbi:T9SS type A sorting domain-containing protein [Flavobacterium caeni]|nr:T9SS type A sorting domain-containing protein [Flavobacterium caeni]